MIQGAARRMIVLAFARIEPRGTKGGQKNRPKPKAQPFRLRFLLYKCNTRIGGLDHG